MTWNFDPVLISVGFISIHWYGALFALALLCGYYLNRQMFRWEQVNISQLDNLLFYLVLGVVIGARLAHCLFYEPAYYLAHPLEIFALWQGGLASHGGGVGAILGIYLFARTHKLSFVWLVDRIIISAALFGAFVRCANFLNSEILGAPTHSAWGVIFERVDDIPRHAAQLYEAFAYFLIFLVLMALYAIKSVRACRGALSAVFLVLVFSARIVVEFFKETQEAYSSPFALNTGQLLSLPFLISGLVILSFIAYERYSANSPTK